jgi:hypothetical protein
MLRDEQPFSFTRNIEKGEETMTKLRILGVAGLVLMMGASDLMAQRRGGE